MNRIRRGCIAVAIAAVALAACTSQTDDDRAAGSSSKTTVAAAATGTGITQGLTDKTVTISLMAADLGLLSEQHLAPEIGDAEKTLEAVVANINDNGGVAGRKIVLKSHVISGAEAQLNPDVGRQMCTQSTEDDKPFAIIVAAALPADILPCAAIDHKILTITMDSWPDSYYERAQGRLFSLGSQTSVGRDRVYRAWPKILDDNGYLKGKTIGIIRQDNPDQEESADDTLQPAIENLGYKVAAVGVLPCPEGSATCEQHQVAIQRMQDAHVDLVFLLAQNLAGAAVVEAAQNLHFEPQWVTTGNNITDTVSKFYANAKQNYDGAIGLSTIFSNNTAASDECNRIAAAGGAESFPKGSDGYGFTAVTCIQLQSLVDAMEAVQGDIDQAKVIAALENLDPVPQQNDPPGELSHEKHDAGNSVFLAKYSAAAQKFEALDDQKPINVGD